MSVERVEPLGAAEDAALILREAWPLPALYYSDEYLRWQLAFPGGPARAVLAREAGEPAGFMAISPRRFRFRGASSGGYVLSFLGVRPSFQGRGLAGRVYEEILRALRDTERPAVVYVEARAAGPKHLLRKAAERVGLRLAPLAPCVHHGFSLRPGAAPLASVAVEASLDDALGVIEACGGGGGDALWSAPDRAQIEHYLRDPRPRRLFVVEEGGRAVGAAMVLLLEIATATGLDRVSTVDSVFLPEPTAERLTAVLRAAAAAFPGQTTTSAVAAPNLTTIEPAMIKRAGLRGTGSGFDAFVCHAGGHPFLEAAATNLEVV